MQLELFDYTEPFSLEDIFAAYESCRKHKRNSPGGKDFEIDYEQNLITLWHSLNQRTWRPGPSTAFIVQIPVQREIFAALFVDRIVHHLVAAKLTPFFEKSFIYDSYACRIGRGTHFGIQRVQRFMRSCSRNGKQEAWLLKLDIQGFFMNIDRQLLYKKLKTYVEQQYQDSDRDILLHTCRCIIKNNPCKDAILASPRTAWQGIPPDKSLFGVPAGKGLPIGNLTSQILANFFLNQFDHYIKNTLGMRWYGRYVDDFVLVHSDKALLTSLVPQIRSYLANELGLTLHPRKIYLQPVSNGVPFLGVHVTPHRILVGRRVIRNFRNSIIHYTQAVVDHKPTHQEKDAFLASMNSYLGIFIHYHTFRLRKGMIDTYLSEYWYKYFVLNLQLTKFIRR